MTFRDTSKALVSIAASAVTFVALARYRYVQSRDRRKRLLRHASLSTSGSIFSSGFLHAIRPLYDLHMGCENIGPLLYSLIRFLKCTRILEVGAGYTSIYLLQALKDNMEEMESIEESMEETKDRHDVLLQDMFLPVNVRQSQYPALHVMDNLEHEETTAHLVQETADALGSDSFLEFIVADCFDYNLSPDEQYDFIWLDGINTDPKFPQLFQKYWRNSLRDGGYMAVHSTLTNTIARKWMTNLVQETKRQEAMVGVRLEIKPIEANQDLNALAQSIRRTYITTEWIGQERIVPIGFGIHKLVLSAMVKTLDDAYVIAHRMQSEYHDLVGSVDTVEDSSIMSTMHHISFLEPHKRFQNSFTIFQKRSLEYAEPIYSWSP